MGNRCHPLVEKPDGNLSRGMRQLNGVFTQMSNRLYRRSGHLFQGRFKADPGGSRQLSSGADAFVMPSPLRAGMVRDAGDWPWSNYLTMVGSESVPE
jgi:putative transposase